MERQVIEERIEEVRRLVMELQRQGERCALAGLLDQATMILSQVWDMTKECDPHIADAAAWEAGWLRLQMRAYNEAAQWFGRIKEFPVGGSRLWPTARQTLTQLCRELANDFAGALPGPSLTRAVPPHHPQTSILPGLRVMSLGCFQIVRADTVLPSCSANKAIALFRYLLNRRQRAARKEELLELLWPKTRSSAAMHSLHVAVTTLRRYLDPPTGSYLLFEAGHYMIHPDVRIANDAHDFEQYCDEAERYWRAHELMQAQQSYSDAVTCYRGDYYVGEQDFAWIIGEQERLLARYLSALDHLGRILIACKHFEPAIECYRRLLERDGYREDAYCQLMRCYWQLGRRTEALRQYTRCARILANDLALEPMLELQELNRAIQSGCAPQQSKDGYGFAG